MSRISRDQMYLEIARTVSKRSTCFRLNVGSVVVCDNHLVSVGYNGNEPGKPHCEGNQCPLSESGGCTRSVHAEINALDRYNPNLVYKNNLTIYCTHSPCQSCAERIKREKVDTVIYETEYRDTSPVEFLLSKDIAVLRYTPSGYLINKKTNEVTGL